MLRMTYESFRCYMILETVERKIEEFCIFYRITSMNRKSEVRNQKSEIRSQKPTAKSQKSGENMVHFDRIQQKILLIMGLLILVLSGLLIYQGSKARQSDPVDSAITGKQVWEGKATPEVSLVPASIKVYVIGQVRHPGVITMQEGDRVTDAVDLAGGCLPEADLNRINMAMKLKDEGMYYIPFVGEEISSEVRSFLSGEENDAKVNINSADQSLLETLPGIGPSKSKKIIEYREVHGSFKSIEEIMNISGIAEKTFESLKDLITIR